MADGRLYTVTGQRQTRDEGPDGRMIDVVEVSYVAPGNSVGSVRIPVSEYNAANVDSIIRQRVSEHVGISQLGAI